MGELDLDKRIHIETLWLQDDVFNDGNSKETERKYETVK
jgi:hypothetical protein